MKKYRDKKTGKFQAKRGAYIDDKGYIRIACGPQRGQRLHRIVAEAKLGRKLTKDEDVHHKNGDKLDCRPENLEVLGHREHGCVSAKQHHYLKEHDIHLKKEWDEYFEEEGGASVQFP